MGQNLESKLQPRKVNESLVRQIMRDMPVQNRTPFDVVERESLVVFVTENAAGQLGSTAIDAVIENPDFAANPANTSSDLK